MATAVKEFRNTQLGVESTRGTPVATTTRWIGQSELVPQEPVFQPDAQLGILVADGATTDVIAQRHTDVKLMADLTYEQLLHVLMMSMKGSVTPTGGGADKTWVFNPTYLADPALNAFTLDRRLSDGSTNWDETVAYLMARSFRISGNIGENAKLEVDCFGRPILTGETLTAGVALPTVNFVPVALAKLFIDDTAGGIGGTQLACDVVSFDFNFETPVQPKFYITGQADKSFCEYGLKRAGWSLSVVAEIKAAIIAEQAKAAARSIRYVRINFVGAALGGSNYNITIDMPVRYRMGMFDSSGDRDGNDTVTLDFINAYDSATPLGAKITVVNALTALP